MEQKSKLGKLLTIILCSVSLSVGGLGGISLFKVYLGGGNDNGTTSSTVVSESPEVESTITPTKEPTLSPTVESDSAYVHLLELLLKDANNKTADDIKKDNTPVATVTQSKSTDDEGKSFSSNNTVKPAKSENIRSETDQSNKNEEKVPKNEDLLSKTSCQIDVTSPSQLVFISENEIDQNGIVNISYENDSDAIDDAPPAASFDLNNIVNMQDNMSESQQLSYIDIPLGNIIITFENCCFENIDIYLLDSDELSPSNDEIENIVVPSSEEQSISLDTHNSVCRIGIIPEYSFQPYMIFHSECNIDGNIKVVDDDNNELLNVELEQTETEENFQYITPAFELEEGRQYYLDISSSSSIENLSEYTYYFQILTIDSEE